MRPIVLALLISLACDACATRHPQTSAPAARQAVTLDPAPTPADAFERAVRAMAEGDEEAWRRIVVYQPPRVVAEAQALSRFAGARLHRAVRENGVAGRRVRDAGFDRNERLIVPEPPSRRRIEEELAAVRNIQWKVDG